jgi:hypothetical protein
MLEPAQERVLAELVTGDEGAILDALYEQLQAVGQHNDIKFTYYEAHHSLRDLRIAIPPTLRGLDTVVGWPGMVIDVLDERLEIDSFRAANGSDVEWEDIWTENQLETAASEAHVPAMVCGISFLTVGRGRDDEPDPLITVQSPYTTTIAWDARVRRAVAGANFVSDNGQPMEATLYLPYETVQCYRGQAGWLVDSRDIHNLGRVPIFPLINRPSALQPFGRSEITRPIISLTDAGVRTIVGMEVNREFYSSPQRYLLGAKESAFRRPDGTQITGWEAVMGRVWAASRDEQGNIPEAGQFPASSPQPYIGQLQVLSQMIAAEAAIPVHYLGFIQDNPASGDAIRRGEGRLLKRTDRRKRGFAGAGWNPMLRLAIAIRDGVAVADVPPIRTVWADSSIPTIGAAADAVYKLVSSGTLPAADDVTWRMAGISDADRAHLAQWAAGEAERQAQEATLAAAQLATAAASQAGQWPAGLPATEMPPIG